MMLLLMISMTTGFDLVVLVHFSVWATESVKLHGIIINLRSHKLGNLCFLAPILLDVDKTQTNVQTLLLHLLGSTEVTHAEKR